MLNIQGHYGSANALQEQGDESGFFFVCEEIPRNSQKYNYLNSIIFHKRQQIGSTCLGLCGQRLNASTSSPTPHPASRVARHTPNCPTAHPLCTSLLRHAWQAGTHASATCCLWPLVDKHNVTSRSSGNAMARHQRVAHGARDTRPIYFNSAQHIVRRAECKV